MGCELIERISPLVDDELDACAAANLREHVAGCAQCRQAETEFRALRQSIKACAPEADALAQQRALSVIVATAGAKGTWQPRLSPLFVRPGLAIAGVALCAALLIISMVFFRRPISTTDTPLISSNSNLPSWEVEKIAGAPQVGSRGVNQSARLAVGEWLTTDEASRARLDVADIGHVEVDPNSRLRLVETKESEHRLALTRGKIHALIYAPPRLFFVDTPSAVAVDYGCAYTLEVDEGGRSLLHVTAGWVALEAQGRESFVPAGATCVTEPGQSPGTPYFKNASQSFIDALQEVDAASDTTAHAVALAVVLREARKRDGLTLWHLLTRVDGEARERVSARLAQLVPPPAGVTREGILRLDREMLERWKNTVESAWYEDAA